MEWIKLIFDTAMRFYSVEFTLFGEYTFSFWDLLIAILVIDLAIFLICGLINKE